LAFVVFIVIPLFGKHILYLVTYRELYLDSRIFQIESVANRLAIWKQAIYTVFHNFGFGYGMGNYKLFHTVAGEGRLYAVDNFTLLSTHEIGFIATVFL